MEDRMEAIGPVQLVVCTMVLAVAFNRIFGGMAPLFK